MTITFSGGAKLIIVSKLSLKLILKGKLSTFKYLLPACFISLES